ncbi:hypothetical protein [Xanthomonas hortorum]|uniref:DRBM domain-containing protein n=1 Tax=Xanthomonas hortorum pv. vitians TaxID=83224 RepID=A0AAW8ZPL9_9XANT|nr:hypothetical protein [Xanthomonas hortorum]MCE4302376.1 hypothetical protein [Xanthomonas hortorum pv. vitians]MDT7826206.1 hypothetical protein [Xanthomonas hortorum pv. vitians]MDV7248620.1 hypothetical protein [Xanthomonas hortorum pv. vitians]NMI32472.1 hypothetical protein [Xanthomonas hortorum pv. vitians]
MPHRTLRPTATHGYCGEFRVETMEVQKPGEPKWFSNAYVYHRDRPHPIATIEGAGEGADRSDARAQALRIGCAFATSLDPRTWRVA